MKLPAVLLWLFLAVALPMLLQEFMNACPRLARGLVRLASSLIPPAHRDRYLEEWLAELDELEGLQLTMLATAARILLFAPTTGWALRGGPQTTSAPAPAGGSRPKPNLRRKPAIRGRVGPGVIAVVVTSNSRASVRETLRGLAKQTRPIDDIIVVDFGSTDGTREWVASRLGQDALISAGERADQTISGRLGRAVAAALRDAPARARTLDMDWLWLIPAHTAPDPDTLEQLLLEVASRPSVHIAGPRLVDAGTTTDRVAPRRLLEVGWSIDRTGRPVPRVDDGEVDQGQHFRVSDVFFVSTAGMLVRRDMLLAAGGFDPRLAGGLEGLDLCWRTWLLGGRVVVVPSARMRHLGTGGPAPSGRTAPHDQAHYLAERDRVCAMLKATSRWRLPGVLLLAAGGALARAAGLAVTGQVGAAIGVLTAWCWNVKELPETLVRRRQLQRRRKVSDRNLRWARAPRSYQLKRALFWLLTWRDRLIGDPGATPRRPSLWSPMPGRTNHRGSSAGRQGNKPTQAA